MIEVSRNRGIQFKIPDNGGKQLCYNLKVTPCYTFTNPMSVKIDGEKIQ